MTDTPEDADGDGPDARDLLEQAIEENPDEVMRFVQRLNTANRLLDTTDLALAALDDEMVETLTETSGLLAESADGLATVETVRLADSVGANAAHLESALETLVRLETSGTLAELAELADAATLLRAALDDEMVQSLAETGGGAGDVVDALGDPNTVRGLESALGAVGQASDPENLPGRLGPVGLVRALRDPEVQRGLGYLVAVARHLGRDFEDRAADGE